MTTNEKLDRIVAKCREIIALGEKRTQGEWKNKGRHIGTQNHMSAVGEVRDQNGNWSDAAKATNDAAFIAACAGPAEAMAKSTIAAIEGFSTAAADVETHRLAWNNLELILAAWPDEIL